ncbi:MAG TPA: hypothetical protein VJ044_03945 [Candidatus Hodarchaeales archaeon]|nr:hypothetical protein [Candidatus Hodarchaeales archaeon]
MSDRSAAKRIGMTLEINFLFDEEANNEETNNPDDKIRLGLSYGY